MTTIVSGSQIQFNDNTTQNTSAYGGGFAFRNRIINGDCRIDQRNAGASVTPTATTYTLDRWSLEISEASKLSVQQNAGSVTPPVGFINYLGVTTVSAFSVVAASQFQLRQFIEGFNVADLGWGTANAKTVTLSFWVRSSLTGTFGGAFRNEANNRSYPFSYTISSANTWTQISITVAGDTTGTWLTNNDRGIAVIFGLGVGSDKSATAGAWAAGNFTSATGATSVVGTNGATFYITGVQLEKGSTATSFDYRPYGTELQLCQRYYQTYAQPALRGVVVSASAINRAAMSLPVIMRAAPTGTMVGNLPCYDGVTAGTVSSLSASYSTSSVIEYDLGTNGGLTAYRPGIVYQSGSSANYLTLSAEL